MVSRISGIGVSGIENKIRELRKSFQKNVIVLPIGGLYKYRKSGEDHQFQGSLIHLLQHSVAKNSYEIFKKYSDGINNLNPTNLRDLLEFRKIKKPITIDDVETIEKIKPRFEVNMSHGALSSEAHETLAIGMNRINGSSCSGEGGEDEKRFDIQENGDSSNSKVKQVASARFGVTVKYLNNCKEIEIKIAQGAKPGEAVNYQVLKSQKKLQS